SSSRATSDLRISLIGRSPRVGRINRSNVDRRAATERSLLPSRAKYSSTTDLKLLAAVGVGSRPSAMAALASSALVRAAASDKVGYRPRVNLALVPPGRL